MKIKTKKLVSAATLSFLLVTGSGTAHATYVVYDPAAVAQLIQQLEAMYKQYQALKQQYEAMTGKSNMTQGLGKPSEVMPNSWQDIVAQQKSGVYGASQKKYQEVINKIGADKLAELMNGKSFKSDYDSVTAGFAVSEASYQAINTHVNNLKILSARINQTQSIKESQDLNNAIAIEQAQIQSIMARQAAVQSNLSSGQLNRNVQNSQSIKAWNQ